MIAPTLTAHAWNAAMSASPGDLDVHVESAHMTGVIPGALRGGRLLLNGPGWTQIGGRLAHPFDGHGYLRAFELLADGSLRLRARFVETKVYKDERAANRLVHRGLGTNISDKFWQNVGVGTPRNVANTTITRWGDQLLAGWEGGAPHAIDPGSLATRGEQTFGGVIAGQATLAHTKHDVQRKRLVHCSIAMGRHTKLTFREIAEDGTLAHERSVAIPGALFAHDFVITPSYYILASNPLRFKPVQLAKTLLGASTLIQAIATNEAAPSAIHLIPRAGDGPLRTVTLPERAFVVHYGNAFEREGAVFVDACCFTSFEFGAEFGYRGPLTPLDPLLPDQRSPQRLQRITIAAGATRATMTQLAPHGIDFPRVHPEHDGLDTPVLFGASRADTRHSDPFDSLIRVDLRDHDRPPELWTANAFVGEPIFVPESDHVLAVLTDGANERSLLAIFDASKISDGPVTMIPLPLLPIGFHGNWDRS